MTKRRFLSVEDLHFFLIYNNLLVNTHLMIRLTSFHHNFFNFSTLNVGFIYVFFFFSTANDLTT